MVSQAGGYGELSLRGGSSKLGAPDVGYKGFPLTGEASVLSSQGLIGSLGGVRLEGLQRDSLPGSPPSFGSVWSFAEAQESFSQFWVPPNHHHQEDVVL